MGTDAIVAKPTSRHGMAMFIVLGAIVLVTLFGYVGLTLAGKDQTLSGELNDIKSRDEAALASLQFSINRLIEDPDQLVTLLNGFISTGRSNGGKPTSTWLVFDPNAKSISLQKDEPDWLPLSTDANNQSAMKLQILGVGAGDSTIAVTDKKDSLGVYISFRGLARGRRGDEKEVLGSYRIHGLSVNYSQDTLYYTIPRHSFYVGGNYPSPNLEIVADGDVYVGGTGGTFINSDAGFTVKGDLKWNDSLKFNSGSIVNVRGNAYINGYLYSNGATFNVDGNAGIANGFSTMNNSNVWVKKNLWIGGMGAKKVVWGGTLRVGGTLVFIPTDSTTPRNLIVGGNAWIHRQATFNISDSFFVGGNLYFGRGDATTRSLTISGAGKFIGNRSAIISGNSLFTVPDGSNVNDTLQVQGSAAAAKVAGNITVGTLAELNGYAACPNITGTKQALSSLHWVAEPTAMDLGVDTNLSKTSPAQNPMDSVLVDAKHSPQVNSNVITFTSAILGGSSDINAANLNHLYDSLSNANRLLNGYMILRIPKSGSGFSQTTDVSGVGFKGKMLLILEGNISASAGWPHSETKNNIQVILVRHGGSINEFKWNHGIFAGLLYWENPCGNKVVTIPANSVMYGAILLGTTLKSADFGYTSAEVDACKADKYSSSFQVNAGSAQIIRDQDLYLDIGQNLPGVLQSARDASGKLLGTRSSVPAWKRSPLMTLRLVHNSPYFEPIGVFR